MKSKGNVEMISQIENQSRYERWNRSGLNVGVLANSEDLPSAQPNQKKAISDEQLAIIERSAKMWHDDPTLQKSKSLEDWINNILSVAGAPPLDMESLKAAIEQANEKRAVAVNSASTSFTRNPNLVAFKDRAAFVNFRLNCDGWSMLTNSERQSL